LKSYLEAEKRFERGEMLADINAALNAAVVASKSGELAKLAKVVFTAALQARDDAMKGAAPKFVAATWQKPKSNCSAPLVLWKRAISTRREKSSSRSSSNTCQAEREAIQQNPLSLKNREPGKSTKEPSNGSTASKDEINRLKQKAEQLEETVKRQASANKNETSRNGSQEETASRSPAPSPGVEPFAPLEHLFSREEGIVLKSGNDLIIRIYGLDFVERG
jgi:hypothetical protein